VPVLVIEAHADDAACEPFITWSSEVTPQDSELANMQLTAGQGRGSSEIECALRWDRAPL
jgi:hypothetical protein